MTVDLGTGDGRLPYVLAREAPDRFFVGIDANAAGLRQFSGQADRERLPNLVYVRAAVEALPRELEGAADRVTAILPWGSLLAALAGPSVETLRGIRALCRPGATLTVIFGVDVVRDRAEAVRLRLPNLDERHLEGVLASGYAEAGFALAAIRPADAAELRRWPSTWARRLAFGLTRPMLRIDAEASGIGARPDQRDSGPGGRCSRR